MKSKREKSLSPSSSWRETPQPRHTTASTGCFPGFFHILFSKLNLTSNSRKSLTFGSRKQERRIEPRVSQKEAQGEADKGDSSCLPTLLGTPSFAETETRTKLIGALEKCDRDLETLQKTIDAIKTTIVLHHKLSSQAHVVHDSKCSRNGEAKKQPNPIQKLQPAPVFDDARDGIVTKPGKKSFDFDINISIAHFGDRPVSDTTRSVSKEMIDSVKEACKDIEWGEKREEGRIGLCLQDHIYRDLVEEMVKELTGSRVRRLPLNACRRRLSF